METKKRTFVKVPIVDLQKKYEGRAFNMKIDNNGNKPVRVRLFGDGSVFVQAVGGQGGDTPTPGPGGQGLTPEEREAIVSLFRMAVYTGNDAEGYIEILESHATLTSIDAVFNQGAAVIYPTASLESLKQYLTVTAQYDDGTTMNVTDYTLSGTLTAGISTITATYQGFSDTFTVNVTAQSVMTGINAVFTQGAAVIYPTASLDSLRQYLTVDANFSDGSSIRVNAYTLSGTLAAGTSTITAAYEGFTDDFTVIVTAVPTVTSIDAVYTQGNVIVYDGDILSKLKCSLVVTANYSDGTTQVVDDYTLSGTLATGTSTITATYQGFSDTFNVEVSALHAMYSVDGSTFRYCVPTQDSPYWQYREDRFRWSYVDFNLLAEGGKSYRFAMTFTNTENTPVKLGVQAFSQVVLNAVANNNSWVWSQDQWDSGWKYLGTGSLDPSTLYVDVAIPEEALDMSSIVGVRFTVSYDPESSQVREGLSIKNISVIDLSTTPSLIGIDATFNQGGATIYDNASLDSLRQYLTVTAQYTGGGTQVVNDYTLSGTLAAGTSTITATYQGFSDTFTVNVTAQPVMTGINAVFTQGAAVIYPTASLDSLRQYLTVDANYSDGSSIRVNAYTLSGTLAAGISTITAAYEGFTDDFTVIVTAVPTVTSIDAVYTQGNVIVYDGDILDKLKCSLVVTANYSDGTTQNVDDYTLSGTLATGISTITVTREGLTDTFNVEVSALHAMYSVDGSTFRYCVPTQDPPYWQYREDRFRWSYVDFNLLADGGRRYRIAVTFTNQEEQPVRIGLQAFSQIALNAVVNNESWVWSQDQWDSTWQSLAVGSSAPGTYYVDINVPYYYWLNAPNYYIKGFRFTFSYAQESSAIREGLSIKNLDVIDITVQDLTEIRALWSGQGQVIHPDDSLEILRQWLNVSAYYRDNSYQSIKDYTLSGTLEVGTSTITVEYEGYTTTFNLDVTAN